MPVKPLLDAPQTTGAAIAMWAAVIIPFLALLTCIPIAWGWGLSGLDLVLMVVLYLLTGSAITAGYHRCFTHRSFKARRGLRIALAVLASMAVEGSPAQWVANHRRHHAYADRDGDPHSPWRFGTDTRALLKGLAFAHIGWMLKRELSNRARFAPDILNDRDLATIGHFFPLLTAISVLGPGVLAGLTTSTWQGFLSGLFWGGIVRIGLLHHVTWSVNSICHVAGKRPFPSRDKATNFWPLAILSFGESWHNSHHADPTMARHGVFRWQVDPTARMIWVLEKLSWAYDVHWPNANYLKQKLMLDLG